MDNFNLLGKRRLSAEEDPLLIEVKREEVDDEDYQQENSYIVQNPFEQPSICGLASENENVKTYENQNYQEDLRRPRKKIVPLRPGCALEEEMEALDEVLSIQPVTKKQTYRDPANIPIEGQQSRISKKLTIKDYIALERENKKLKEMIATFTREAERMQEKLLSWTRTFKAFSEPKKSPQKPQQRPEAAPPKVYQAQLPAKRRRHSRLPTIPKALNSPGVNSNENEKPSDVPYIKRTSKVVNIPEFPITNICELIDLEKKMREQSYFSIVFDIIYVSFKKSTIQKSVPTLLNHIVNSDLFKFFVWKDSPLGRKRLKMVDFPKFISLFLSLSVKLFGLNQEPKSLELVVKQVLHSHITNANRRNPQNPQMIYGPPKVVQVEPQQPPQTSLVVLNYDLNRSVEPPPIQILQPPTVQLHLPDEKRISLSEEDMEKYFTPETHLDMADDGSHEEDDDVQDITPVPVSIDISVDDSD